MLLDMSGVPNSTTQLSGAQIAHGAPSVLVFDPGIRGSLCAFKFTLKSIKNEENKKTDRLVVFFIFTMLNTDQHKKLQARNIRGRHDGQHM